MFTLKHILLIMILFAFNKAYSEIPPPAHSPKKHSSLREESLSASPSSTSDDKDQPAKGLILTFKSWPLNPENKNKLLEKAKTLKLREKVSYSHFKVYVFEWEEWTTKALADKACESFLNFPDLIHCDPDLLQKIHTGMIRKKNTKKARKRTMENIRKSWTKKLGTKKEEPKSDIVLDPPETFSNDQSGDVKSCKIISAKVNLMNGELSDYWAQEMIGSDLMREELKKVPPVKKHLVAVWDSPYYSSRHDIASRHIISHKGKQAVLPEIGNSITMYDHTLGSYGLGHSEHILNHAQNTCQKYQSPPSNQENRGSGAVR